MEAAMSDGVAVLVGGLPTTPCDGEWMDVETYAPWEVPMLGTARHPHMSVRIDETRMEEFGIKSYPSDDPRFPDSRYILQPPELAAFEPEIIPITNYRQV